jgi:AcrR family transcriptional regulator
MSISERKTREKQEMKALILNAAKDMFIQEGFEKTSLRKIADKIEYSPTTIYLYYKDKTEIFHELMEIGFSILLNRFSEDMKIVNPIDRLYALGETYITFALENSEYYDLMFITKNAMDKVHTADDWCSGKKTFMCLQNTVEDCIAQNQLKSKDPNTATLAFWAQVHGVVSLYIRDRMKMFPKESIKDIIYASTSSIFEMIKK